MIMNEALGPSGPFPCSKKRSLMMISEQTKASIMHGIFNIIRTEENKHKKDIRTILQCILLCIYQSAKQ
jgi:hypothetical protein